tara:strand:+ start:114 stop:821 length:708 start_codon:yes stop_codon:yes gene_type:complete
MKNNLIKATIISLSVVVAAPAMGNLIYIDQIGNNLDLDIIQDGQDNTIGDSVTDATFSGDDMTFSITQTGSYNIIAATIKGNDYIGTWDIAGDSNDINFTCDSLTGVNCETVTMNVTVTGNNQDLDIFVGEAADSNNLIANITIDGDDNVVAMDVDGVAVTVTLDIDNSMSLAIIDDNSFDIDITGDGDVNGHTVIMDHTGGGATVVVDQSGVNDNYIEMTTNGEDAAINITQSD